ncbi:MAG: hypothetical protein ACE5HV_12975 [Acidobacteriota bacterium]
MKISRCRNSPASNKELWSCPAGHPHRGRGPLALGLTLILLLPVVVAGASSGEAVGVPPGGVTAGGGEPAASSQEVRVKDLAVLEDLLVDAVEEAIESSVQQINASNTESSPQGQAGELSYVFGRSGRTGARGMFLAGYGVLFTVQLPTLNTTTLYRAELTPLALAMPDVGMASKLAREMQIRSQMQMLEQEISDLSQRLEEELASTAAAEREQVSKLLADARRSYAQARQSYAELSRKAAAESPQAVETQPVQASDRQREVGRRRAARRGFIGTLNSEELGRMRQAAEQRKAEVESAVIEAVVDTLGQYGRIIHGLQPSDRLAVLLLPSSYQLQIQRWMRATSRPEEFVISVLYGDIQALDKQKIDAEEFGNRVHIESRLGQPHSPPERQEEAKR